MLRKKEESWIKLSTLITLVFLFIYMILAFQTGNKEFIYYDFLVAACIVFAYMIHRRIRLHLPIFILILVVFLMHVSGGDFYFNGARLYDMIFGFLKYDNIVHFTGTLTAVFVVYNLIHGYFNEKKKYARVYLFLVLSFMAMGFATLIELIELIAVLFLNAGPTVGGYMNNAIDLFYNMLGALIGSIIIVYNHFDFYLKNSFLYF